MSPQSLIPAVLQVRQPLLHFLTTLLRRRRKLLLALLSCFACGPAHAQSCPNIPEGGGQSISAQITNADTGAELARGPQPQPSVDVVTVGTRIRIDSRATAYGRCIGRALYCDGPCECRNTGRVYERVVNHINVWADISTAGALNGPYTLGYVFSRDDGGATFEHELDTTASNSTGPIYYRFPKPGTYHIYVLAVIGTTICSIQPDRTETLSFTFHVQ